jgi:hypothetical protein
VVMPYDGTNGFKHSTYHVEGHACSAADLAATSSHTIVSDNVRSTDQTPGVRSFFDVWAQL